VGAGGATEEGRRQRPAAEGSGSRGGGRCRGGRALWMVGIAPGGSCEGDGEVSTAREPLAVSNRGGGRSHRRWLREEIRTEERAEIAGEGRWSFWVVGRC
jgi:hypothetical protein